MQENRGPQNSRERISRNLSLPKEDEESDLMKLRGGQPGLLDKKRKSKEGSNV